MKRLTIIFLAGLAIAPAMAKAQTSGSCWQPGGDSYVTGQEAKDQGKFCLISAHRWNPAAYMVVVSRINATAVRVQEKGPGLHYVVLVDWDPAWTDQTGKRQPAAYWLKW